MLYLNPKFLLLRHVEDPSPWSPWHLASIMVHPPIADLARQHGWRGKTPVLAWVPALAPGTLKWLGWLEATIARQKRNLTPYQRAVIEDIKATAGPAGRSHTAVGASRPRPDPAWLLGEDETAAAWMAFRGQIEEWCGYKPPELDKSKWSKEEEFWR